MNKIFIIGNGFDLAHGLKTKYSDFLLWYINKCIRAIDKNTYCDELIRIDTNGNSIREIKSLTELKPYLAKNFTVSSFLEAIISEYYDYNWVNIEFMYYIKLIELFRGFEKISSDRNNYLEGKLKELNTSFELLRKELEEYLAVNIHHGNIENAEIKAHILREFEYTNDDQENRTNSCLFLNFNYTDTISIYEKYFDPDPDKQRDKVINIHGELRKIDNPIIFGYGDEMDIYYEKIERLNLNEFIKNFKSFGYFKTNNYRKLFTFINTNPYNVVIMGHSCGISDRVLLTEIFNNVNCRYIKILYHQRDSISSDFEEKTQEISRHFPTNAKGKMRLKVISKGNSAPLTIFKPTTGLT